MPDHPTSPFAATSRDASRAERIVEGSLDELELVKATRRAVTRALAEDLGDRGDVTGRATVPAALTGEAEVVAREAGVISGLAAMVEAFAAVDSRIKVELHVANAATVIEDQVIATVTGSVRSILAAERTALNFLGHLSGIATTTAELVRLVEDAGCQIRDTRKTTPGLRLLEKAAVLDGGGGNHRIGLFDAVLVKDNHIRAAGGLREAVEALRAADPDVAIQVEVEDVDQLREVLDLGVQDVMLDNFTIDEVRHAVSRVDGRARLEVSGNLDVDSVRAYAEALGEGGRLAVGAVTHSSVRLDVALDIISTQSLATRRPTPAAAVVDEVATTPPPPTPSERPSWLGGASGDERDGGSGSRPGDPSTEDRAEPMADFPSIPASDARGSRTGGLRRDDASDATPDEREAPPRRRRISSFFSGSDEDGDNPVQPPASLQAPEPGPEPEAESMPSAAPADMPAPTGDPVSTGEDEAATGAPHGTEDDVDAAAAGGPDPQDEGGQELEPLGGTADRGEPDPAEPESLFGSPEALQAVEGPASSPTGDSERIRDAEVDAEPFSWRQSPFRQRRPNED